eukprot:4057599-Amphidinium_carterae.1
MYIAIPSSLNYFLSVSAVNSAPLSEKIATMWVPSKLSSALRVGSSSALCFRLKEWSDEGPALWGCQTTRKSTTGTMVQFAGAAISISSKTQEIVAYSSAEAELYALGTTVKNGIYVRNILRDRKIDFTEKQLKPTTYTNSSSAKCLHNLEVRREQSTWTYDTYMFSNHSERIYINFSYAYWSKTKTSA